MCTEPTFIIQYLLDLMHWSHMEAEEPNSKSRKEHTILNFLNGFDPIF